MKKSGLLATLLVLVTTSLLASCGGGAKPAAPSKVRAEPDSGFISIRWEHRGNNETGFNIYRKPFSGPAAGTFEAVGKTGADSLAYQDTSQLDPAQKYLYAVAAVNGYGESPLVASEEPVQPLPTQAKLRLTLVFGPQSRGKGTVTSEDGKIECSESVKDKCTADYTEGESVTLNAVARVGSEFVSWGGEACSGGSSCTVKLDTGSDANADATIEVVVTFKQTGYGLLVEKKGTGDGTLVSSPAGIDCGDDCSQSYPLAANEPVKVGFASVEPGGGSLFDGWGGDCPTSSATSPCTVTMAADKTVVAYFSKPNSDVYKVEEGGTLTKNAAQGVLANDLAGAAVAGTDLVVTTKPLTAPAYGSLTLKSDGSFTYQHDGSETKSDSFTYEVADLRKNKRQAAVTINIASVNDAPVAKSDTYEVNEDEKLEVGAADGVLKNDSDVDNDKLTAQATEPEYGELTFNPDGSFDYTPTRNFSGEDSFTYRASDGVATSAPATVTIKVNPVNDAPKADGQTVTTLEDTPKKITLTASDVDGDSLSYEIVKSPGKGTLSGAGKDRTYTPNTNATGTDDFTFQVFDGAQFSKLATVTINITSVNDAPVARDDAVSTDEDTPVTGNVLGDNGNGADSDPDDGPQPLKIATVNGDAANVGKPVTLASGALLTLEADGSFRYDPNAKYETLNDGDSATDTFTYTITDGADSSSPATVTVTIVGVTDAPTNTPPTANPQEVTTDEDTPVNITLSGSDPEGQPLTYAIVDSPTHGTLSGDAPDLTYTPTPNYNGADQFTFTVTDPGGSTSAAAPVSVTVSAVNDPPVADAGPDQSVSVNTVVTLDGTASFDSDGSVSAYAWTFSADSPSGASLDDPSSATPSFTPAAVGVYTLELVVTDDSGVSSTADSVSITVN